MRKSARRMLLAAMATALITGSTALTPATHARAAGLEDLACSAGATLAITSDLPHHWLWALAGGGQCVGLDAVYTANIAGSGTSTGLGLCDSSGVVVDLDIDMALTLTSTVTGQAKAEDDHWQSQVTTFPLSTAFTVVHNFITVGLGNLDTHIFIHCPPGGTPSTFLVWDQLENV